MSPKKVAILGGGSWGTAIARIVGRNAQNNKDMFDSKVVMWVFEEQVDGRKLTDIINTEHENIKYMPNVKIPENVHACPDIVESVTGADILISILPHQFVSNTYKQIQGKVKPDAIAISLTKGLSSAPSEGIKLVSTEIQEILGIEVAVLMGANLAVEVARDNYCEATIGTKKPDVYGNVLKTLFHSPNFRINVVKDLEAVELCGALKNIVACGAGFADGLGYGDNTKAAIIRLGMMEIVKFVNQFYPGAKLSTFFESCGLADLVTTCYGGRNRKVCEAFVKSDKSMEEIERELLNGQSAQGPLTAHEVYELLHKTKSTENYPLFVAVHRICNREIKPDELIECLRSHPEHE